MLIAITRINFNKKYLFFIFFIFFLNLAFYLTTINNVWVSDDYGIIFGLKLFKLINHEESIIFINPENRFQPVYWLVSQYIPSDYRIWHGFVVLVYFLTAVAVYHFAYIISKNQNFSYFASFIFSINYSISAKSLIWACFFAHIFHVFFGLISCLIFYQYYKSKNKTKYLHLLIFFILSLINFSLTEGGVIYIFLNLFFLFFLFEKNYILLYKNFFLLSIPLLIYFLSSNYFTGSPVSTLENRSKLSSQNYYKNIFLKKGEELYYYRSTYSPRDLKGYTLRFSDNILNSLNLSSLEKSFHNIKSLIKPKLVIVIFLFCFFLAFTIVYLTSILYKNKKLKDYTKYFIFYLTVLLIYSLIYHRRDLNLLLSVSSSLLLAKILVDLIEIKEKLLFVFILSSFLIPSIIYSYTKFNYFGDFNSKENIQNFNELKIKSKQQFDVNYFEKNKESKFYYYYINFDGNKSYLRTEFKGLNYFDFTNKLINKN